MATKTRTKTRGLTQSALDAELRSLVSVCSVLLEQRTNGDLREAANLTGLSVMTVWRVWHGRYTKAIHFGTVQRFAAAVGLEIVTDRRGVPVRVVGRMSGVI